MVGDRSATDGVSRLPPMSYLSPSPGLISLRPLTVGETSPPTGIGDFPRAVPVVVVVPGLFVRAPWTVVTSLLAGAEPGEVADNWNGCATEPFLTVTGDEPIAPTVGAGLGVVTGVVPATPVVAGAAGPVGATCPDT